ncbi:hypothetical protein ACIBG6_31015 [Streptomyces sp. NPDC050842]|uniref:hypothetical protein n=1 Tax=Streptomyces sp. NPDC050842 TaxID=3365636 RepID=UPI00379588DC
MTHGNDRAAYERALAGTSRLFAVWPGDRSSHLFVIDDLDEYAKAHGIRHDEERPLPRAAAGAAAAGLRT